MDPRSLYRRDHEAALGVATAGAEDLHRRGRHGEGRLPQGENPDSATRVELELLESGGERRPGVGGAVAAG